MSYHTGDGIMNRNEWTFSYSGGKLAEAALKKMQYRYSREEFWKNKKEEIMDEIRKTGLEINESIADQFSNSSYGSGPTLTVNAELQKKMKETVAKIQEHNYTARQYSGWLQVMRVNKEMSYALTIDDWLFFFGDEIVKGDNE